MDRETRSPGGPALAPLLETGAVTLVGGRADEGRLTALLAWLAGVGERAPWWCCLEWTDRMRLEALLPALPEDAARLVWGRWFGAPGDLEAWRDGDSFRWRFVGHGGLRPPLKAADTDAFDPARGGDAGLRLRPVSREAFLWPRDDARVATASPEALRLLPAQPGRARVRYVEYLDRGTVAAVRYVGVAGPAEDLSPEGAASG